MKFLMIVPESNLRSARLAAAVKTSHRAAWLITAALLVAAVVWVVWVESQISYYATHDQARHADAIAVFGAAEYDGRPSPVLRARLDHGLELYQEKLAPLIITLGGGEATDLHSEGGVGRDYLMAHGVPDSAIIAETESRDTDQSARRLAVIARENHLKTIVVVSDGKHLFRVHALCESMGLHVYTSPRPEPHPLPFSYRLKRNLHELLSYTYWRLMHLLGLE
ncbi:MAG TPA: YdcF family protein [Acidobacteriaceae bacterium]|nr:YdcF family protein [Acidobacteriaceae bacterium]